VPPKQMPDSRELARLCTLDLGREITGDDIRRYLLLGDVVFRAQGFTPEEISDILATVVKAMDA
jgi:hypothetical protein